MESRMRIKIFILVTLLIIFMGNSRLADFIIGVDKIYAENQDEISEKKSDDKNKESDKYFGLIVDLQGAVPILYCVSLEYFIMNNISINANGHYANLNFNEFGYGEYTSILANIGIKYYFKKYRGLFFHFNNGVIKLTRSTWGIRIYKDESGEYADESGEVNVEGYIYNFSLRAGYRFLWGRFTFAPEIGYFRSSDAVLEGKGVYKSGYVKDIKDEMDSFSSLFLSISIGFLI
ncbi:MAG: hypothetical protein KKH98_09760 [Spirochaetes bacterium]|nr:hypothetical protein [Spirochaetota bacterium]